MYKVPKLWLHQNKLTTIPHASVIVKTTKITPGTLKTSATYQKLLKKTQKKL